MSTDTVEREQLLTRDEVAAMLRLDSQTLARWAARRRNLPFVKSGQFVRYRLSDVQAFLDHNVIAEEDAMKK